MENLSKSRTFFECFFKMNINVKFDKVFVLFVVVVLCLFRVLLLLLLLVDGFFGGGWGEVMHASQVK